MTFTEEKFLSSTLASGPQVSWTTATQTVNESIGTVTVSATLPATQLTDVTIPFTVSGTSTSTDHNATNGTLTIPAGSTSTSYTFSVINDSLFETTEIVLFTIGTPTNIALGSPSIHTVTITDNDSLPVVNFTASSQTASESAGTVTVTAQLNTASGAATLIPLSISGTATSADHGAQSTTLTIPAGNTTASYTFTVANDSLFEASKSVILTMGSITNAIAGATNTHTVTITDNDTAPIVNFSTAAQTINEGAGSVTVQAQLNTASGLASLVPFTVSGTSTSADHNATSGTVTIPAGTTSANYTFTITDDAIIELNETVILTMGTPVNATAGTTTVQTVTIQDNEGLPSLTIADATVSEGVAPII